MLSACNNESCLTPGWMRKALLLAGTYHLLFAIWAICWPHLWFDWLGVARPNHPMLWQGVGMIMGVLGLSLVVASRNPIRNWVVVLIGFCKFSLGVAGFLLAFIDQEIPLTSWWMMVLDDLIWLPPFALILWASLSAHSGVPPSRSSPLTVEEASKAYLLSNGKSLAAASESQLLALVFLRHFGCTFTRQILRGLETIEREAQANGALLVLVHMLQEGGESEYLDREEAVPRIADPRCELYRAFGLGKGGFLELFGPQVWWRGALAIFQGCGIGHLAGDGLQMPGAFLFRDGKIISSQRARSASDLPDLHRLFQDVSAPQVIEPRLARA